mgnify:FL=1
MRRRGRFERQHRLPRLHGWRLALLIACLIQAALSGFCWVMLARTCSTLPTQSAADVWRGDSEERFAQVSAFLPVDGKLTLDSVRSFRMTLEEQFVQNSMEAPEGGKLYTDAYSGRTSLSASGTSPGNLTVTAIGVGGDFFLFHPLPLLSGSYLTAEDYMADRVVLDAQTAFTLFGSSDVAGMEVTIGGKTFPVAGVIDRESDFASTAALATTADTTSSSSAGSSGSQAMIFMSYDALNALSELPIDCYEIVLPDPVSGFAKGLITDNFPIGSGTVVQNTGRFSLTSLISVIGSFGKRVMTTSGVVYPYWENAARMLESYAALYLLLAVLLALMPAVCLVIVLVRFVTGETRKAAYKAAHAIEARVEEKKQEHYIKGGI